MKKMHFNLKNLATVLACFAVVVMLFSCKKDDKASGDNRIITFRFIAPDAIGEIDQTAKTIYVRMPEGTDFTNLTPTIVVAGGATVDPASGVAQDFTNPVTYTVTAENGAKAEYVVTVTEGDIIPGVVEELPEVISTSTTLKDKGLAVDYIFKGSSKGNPFISVTNDAIITIEPGVTIQFLEAHGGIVVEKGSQIIAEGTATRRIQFIGATSEKGSWNSIEVQSDADNSFKYCDFIGGGHYSAATVLLAGDIAKLAMEYCSIKNSSSAGYYVSTGMNNLNAVAAFNNNVITGCGDVPVWVNYPFNVQKFDITSDLTGNAIDYIHINGNIHPLDMDLVFNQTSVPYYLHYGLRINKTFTINEGTTIYMNNKIEPYDGSRLFVNGTEKNPVTFTLYPGESENSYWGGISIYRSAGSILKWCTIEKVGAYWGAIDLSTVSGEIADVTLENVTIKNNKGYGVRYLSYCNVHHTGVNERFSNNLPANVLKPGDIQSDILP